MTMGREQAIYSLMDQMAHVQQKSRAFVDHLTKQEALSQNQLMLLVQLRLAGSLKITDVAEWFVITPGAASFMCDKLEGMGLLERVRNAEDRRVVRIRLTEAGIERVYSLFADYKDEELAAMSSTLGKIGAMMNEILPKS